MTVRIDGRERPVYLRNSGGLGTVLAPGRTVLCRPVEDPERKTDFDAIAVDVNGTWVTVDATLPNTVFASCLRQGLLDRFRGSRIRATEPTLPDGGRADFRLSSTDDDSVLVEVKSNTYVVDGVSKFPDRPTERGRRQLATLTRLASAGDHRCHVVFVVQRPDVEHVRPFRAVDPDFAAALRAAREAGVTITALATAFHPPTVLLSDPDVPVETG